jgi:TRAP-type C4-dicarboxylate transport system substrate-binding protein
VMLMNMASWNKLSKNLQDILMEAVIESEKRVMAFWKERSQSEAQVLAKAGVQVLALPPAEQTKLLQVVSDESWKELMQKAPKTAPEMKKLLTKAK